MAKLKVEELSKLISKESEANKEYDRIHYDSILNKAFMSDKIRKQSIVNVNFDEENNDMKEMKEKVSFANGLSYKIRMILGLLYDDVIKKIWISLPIVMIASALVIGLSLGFALSPSFYSVEGFHTNTNTVALMGVAFCFGVPSLLIAMGFLPNMIINKKNDNTLSRLRLRGVTKDQLFVILFVCVLLVLTVYQIFLWQIWTPLFNNLIYWLFKPMHYGTGIVNVVNPHVMIFILQMFITNSVIILCGLTIGFYFKNPKIFLILFSIFSVLFLFYFMNIGDMYLNDDSTMKLSKGQIMTTTLSFATIVTPFNLLNHGLIISIHDKNMIWSIEQEMAFNKPGMALLYPNETSVVFYYLSIISTFIVNTSLIVLISLFRRKIIRYK